MKKDPAPPELLEEALGRIASSRTFARSSRAIQLLCYVVKKAGSHLSAEIKEYTIALEVFGRQNYDSKVDSLVRVEAAKLRRLLARYYQSEGAAEPVRIAIPKGGYVPAFEWRDREHSWLPVRRAAPIVAAAAPPVVLAMALLWQWPARVPRPQAVAPPSIAVLPFTDMREAGLQDAFCDGLTEEVIGQLAALQGLRVISRSFVFQFQNANPDASRMGRELKVHAVLEGSVRLENQHLRVGVRLVDARDGFHLWSRTYDGSQRDRLPFQQRIAEDVAETFQTELRGVRRALVRQQTRSPSAYHYYHLAARLEGTGDTKDVNDSIAFYQAAVAADPQYALAWAGLACAWTVLANAGDVPAREALLRAGEAEARALTADPNLAEAQRALGRVKVLRDRDWNAADRAFRRAVQLDPTFTEAYYDHARLVLNPMGRFRESDAQLSRALVLDPKYRKIRMDLAETLIAAREYARAKPQLETILQIAPRAPATHLLLGVAAASRSDYPKALKHFRTAAAMGRSPMLLAHLGYTTAKLGRAGETQAILAELQAAWPGKPGTDFGLGVILAARGDKDRAFASLRRACQNAESSVLWIRMDYRLRDLRTDPRFQELLRAARLE